MWFAGSITSGNLLSATMVCSESTFTPGKGTIEVRRYLYSRGFRQSSHKHRKNSNEKVFDCSLLQRNES
jgi:hypothetical protein